MAKPELGSTWKKWDLHVHTPESFYHNYPGTNDEAWEAFISDLERLPSEFKVIGINDYVLVDGYEKVLNAKNKQNRLKNIDLILPVIELRLDKFGGVIQGGGGNRGSSWSRINIHVIFDQVDPEFIRQQFLSAISPSYKLLPGSGGIGKWSSVISRQSIESLGRAIIQSVPEEKRSQYGNALMEGFNNLNVSAEGLQQALKNEALAGKFIVAIGKTEWENLKWDDHTIAEKKTLINNANLVFTAAQSPDDYKKAKNALEKATVNSKILDCSDAHWLSSAADKDRIGNCFTWMKADCTFKGLLQSIEEFDDRVYVGDRPPKLSLVDLNKTKFINAVSVKKKVGSTLSENWFDLNIPLNPDLVAIIGNKGSGKSALADIIALIGSTKNHSSFSFLNPQRFRSPKSNPARHFSGSLIWSDGTSSSRDLDQNPDSSDVERVKYLPQSYLETLCNELGDKGSDTFDSELRKIIYSHVSEEDKLGKTSMDELLDFKVAEINQARLDKKKELSRINSEILELEKRMDPQFKRGLEAQRLAKISELAALEASPPDPVEDPDTSAAAQEESHQAGQDILRQEAKLQEIESEATALKDRKTLALKKQAVARKIIQALTNQFKQHEIFLGELQGLIQELGEEFSADDFISLKIDQQPANNLLLAMHHEITNIDNKLQGQEADSITNRRLSVMAELERIKSKLDERQRLYVVYRETLVAWERQKADITGAKDKLGTIEWLDAEIVSLGELPNRLAELKAERSNCTRAIHGHIQQMVNEYQRLYGAVQEFVQSAQKKDMQLPLEFLVRIEETNFEDQFLSRINRQVRGSFSGIEESALLLRSKIHESQFDTAESTINFVSMIDDMLHIDYRDGVAVRETKLIDQLRKGGDPQELLDYIFGLDYLSPRYSLTYDGQEIGQLSPGERGLLLLVFYLLVDKEDIPIVIDQPEENLDNQTIFRVLVKCIKEAKDRRQVIMVTHNPNLAVVCDAEQIIFASCNKLEGKFEYESGAIEREEIKNKVVEILEGTEPAFKNRQSKYRLQ